MSINIWAVGYDTADAAALARFWCRGAGASGPRRCHHRIRRRRRRWRCPVTRPSTRYPKARPSRIGCIRT